ncbi:MAG: ABC transporter substrate-binding protein [Gammaproteobacteria bacterium]
MRAILPALLALLLAACGQPPDATIRLGIANAPVILDPRLATDAASDRIDRLLFARLVDFDAAFRPRPALADWRELAPTHYRFTLRSDRAPFHDGSPLTAADVEATYRSLLDPALVSPLRAAFANLAGVRAVDADTVDFTLHAPDPLFPGLLTVGILPARLAGAGSRAATVPIGSGPLALERWPEPERLRLRRVVDGARIEVLAVKDPTVRALKLVRGELDLAQGDIAPELLAWLGSQRGIAVERRPGSTFAYLGFRMDDPVAGQPAVRQAIALAIDREAIVRHLFAGAARPAGALLPPEHWAGHPALRGSPYDPARARALLRAAGFGPPHPPRLDWSISNDPFRLRIATVIQRQLAEAGIEVAIRSHDWGTFYGDIKAGRFQMFSLSWVGLKLPDAFRYAFHSASVPPAGSNRGRYASPAVDGLIEAAEREPDPDRRIAPYRALQERIAADLPYVPLWFEDYVLARRADIEGYHPGVDGNYDDLARVSRQPP